MRVFHALLAVCFAAAWLTAESDRLAGVHAMLGYTMAGLVGFRVAWGLLGTRHARFRSFVRGPGAVFRYLGSLLRGRPEHHTGHNPAGAVAIILLLLGTLLVALTGWAAWTGRGGEWLEEAHEALAGAMLGLVALHIGAVVVSSWLHRENLATAMVTGRKRGEQSEAVRRAWRPVAALMVGAVVLFWWTQWDTLATERPLAARESHEEDDD